MSLRCLWRFVLGVSLLLGGTLDAQAQELQKCSGPFSEMASYYFEITHDEETTVSYTLEGVQPGDHVVAVFLMTEGCERQVTLASYRTPQMSLMYLATGFFAGGTSKYGEEYRLEIDVPDCSFLVTFTLGGVVEKLPADFQISDDQKFSSGQDDGVVNAAYGAAGIACGEGCTGTIGYWKNHVELMADFLPVWLGNPGGEDTLVVNTLSDAEAVLSQRFHGSPSNGITKLYAQLFAAKMAIRAGADDSTVWRLIQDADDFLATHGTSEWDLLTTAEKNLVLGWQRTLTTYNNGNYGPSHC